MRGCAGMGSAPSAPVAGMGSMGSGIMSMNSGPLPVIPGESRASAPLPMYGSNHGLLVDGHRRGRETRGRGGAVYSPQVLVSKPPRHESASLPVSGTPRVISLPMSCNASILKGHQHRRPSSNRSPVWKLDRTCAGVSLCVG